MSSIEGSMIRPLYCLLYILIIQSLCTNANDTLNHTQQLLLDQTLISGKQIFELGFFSPNGSSNRYLGIRYKNVSARKIVWVANREHPLSDNESASSLKFEADGNLRLEDGKQNTIWLTNVSTKSNNTVAVLQDSGNFILKDSETGSIFWESFDYPGDTLLPGMKLGVNTKTGEKRNLSSWKDENDPAPGKFVSGLSVDEFPQYITWNGSIPYWRSGPWNGWQFLGIPADDDKGYADAFKITPNGEHGTTDFEFATYNESYIAILTLTPLGVNVFMNWRQETNEWFEAWKAPDNRCDRYGTCGAFGLCNNNESPICQCLHGFIPRSNEEWSKGNWRGGCVRRTDLLCERNGDEGSKPDEFKIVRGIKLPDDYSDIYDANDANDCEKRCLNNCACVAYAYPERIKCLIWTSNLTDMQLLSFEGEGDIFIRLAESEIGGDEKNTKLIISLTTISSIILLAIFVYYIHRRKSVLGGRRKRGKESVLGDKSDLSRSTSRLQLSEEHKFSMSSTELPTIDFAKIVLFTDNFSDANKLGEGGFRPVYKGKMENGQLIAVKRLSRHSCQGNEEFKNEILLISKLQHRNLVRLSGCCIHGEEKLLVYEYMKNKSLDAFIFDSKKKLELDWAKRFLIIQGIARGILYLHRDSLLRIIHRDLKASNVLLDDDMNPKISDFGLARTFRVTQELANTHRVVGTFGYMSPEYAIWGQFSEKSDVYGFGVLLLEIVSGRKNTGFMDEHYLSLLDSAWKSWNEYQCSDLLDPLMVDSCSPSEVMRCIQIGLLCVQDQPGDRPTMSHVVLMLSRETDLIQPKQPTFAPQTWSDSTSGPSPNLHSMIADDISLIEGR